ncbi:hypothetical protein J4E89_006666 [Alternaria sp. Ai002NY15]|nr:hypothetical protein J4E89_006666 [Alternaria sp. Ai002NY15]
MEGVAAFSLACNVIQIAELSRKIIATAKEIQTSRNGLPKDHEDLRTAVEILRRDVADLQQNHNGDIIQSLAVQSEVAINEHIALLDSLRLKGARTFLHASAAAFKARRKQRQLYESQAKVDRLSEELKAHIIMTRIPNIDRNVDHLGDKIASHNFSIDHDMKIIEQHLSRVRKVTENNSNTANATAELVVELQRWLNDQQDFQANRQCLHALYFSELRSRADQVKRAHEDTFSWIFDGAGDLFGSVHKNKFKNWLRLDDPNRNVFWVYGKPGAGKSTLIKHEMSKLSFEFVGLAHRSMAELLDKNDMKHQIMTEAGMAFDMPELYAQASMAALKAEASIAWTLGSTQDSGYHFGKKDPNDVEKNLRNLLRKLVPIMEQTEEEQMKAHWSKLDDLLNFPLTQEINLKAIIMGRVSKEFSPDIFAVAVVYPAPKKFQML